MSEASLTRVKLKGGFGGLFAGVGCVFWGLRKIMTDGELRKLAAIPLALTTVLYVTVVAVTVLFTDDLFSLIWSKPEEAWYWIVLWYAAVVVVVLCAFVVLALLFTTIAEAIGGPFYDKMAIRILEDYHIETREPGLIEGTVPDLVRSLFFLLPAIFCSVLGLIPVIGLFFAAIGAIIAWLGFASAAINPALMVTEHKLGQRVGYIGHSFFAMVGIGLVVGLSLMVPLVGLLSIPSSIVGSANLYAQSRTEKT